MVLITSLCDGEAYPAADILDLYLIDGELNYVPRGD